MNNKVALGRVSNAQNKKSAWTGDRSSRISCGIYYRESCFISL